MNVRAALVLALPALMAACVAYGPGLPDGLSVRGTSAGNLLVDGTGMTL